MELLVVVITWIIILSFSMLKPCFSQQIIQFQNTNLPHRHHAAAAPDYQLPRKLRLQTTTTTTIKSRHTVDDDHLSHEFTRGKYVERQRVRVETWKEWKERKNDDTSSEEEEEDVLFTMDYSRFIRSHPPIHNKTGLPVAP